MSDQKRATRSLVLCAKERNEVPPKKSKERWLCFICRRDEVQDARASVLCKTYVHEICVDLTATYVEEVTCPLYKKYY